MPSAIPLIRGDDLTENRLECDCGGGLCEFYEQIAEDMAGNANTFSNPFVDDEAHYLDTTASQQGLIRILVIEPNHAVVKPEHIVEAIIVGQYMTSGCAVASETVTIPIPVDLFPEVIRLLRIYLDIKDEPRRGATASSRPMTAPPSHHAGQHSTSSSASRFRRAASVP